MLWQILMLATLVTITLLLWHVITILKRIAYGQLANATVLLDEIRRIAAGTFLVATRHSKLEDGWTTFDDQCSELVQYINRKRLEEQIEGNGIWDALRAARPQEGPLQKLWDRICRT